MAKRRGSQASSTKAARSQKTRSQKSQKSQKRGGRQSQSGGVVKFARDIRGELKRVSWPNREQLQQSTAVVIIIVLVLLAYVAAWDYVFENLSRLIFT